MCDRAKVDSGLRSRVPDFGARRSVMSVCLSYSVLFRSLEHGGIDRSEHSTHTVASELLHRLTLFLNVDRLLLVFEVSARLFALLLESLRFRFLGGDFRSSLRLLGGFLFGFD